MVHFFRIIIIGVQEKVIRNNKFTCIFMKHTSIKNTEKVRLKIWVCHYIYSYTKNYTTHNEENLPINHWPKFVKPFPIFILKIDLLQFTTNSEKKLKSNYCSF